MDIAPRRLLMGMSRMYLMTSQMKARKKMRTKTKTKTVMQMENERLKESFTSVDFARRALKYIINSVTGRSVQSCIMLLRDGDATYIVFALQIFTTGNRGGSG